MEALARAGQLLFLLGLVGQLHAQAEPATVRILILSLFHPRTLVLSPATTLRAGSSSGLSVNGEPTANFKLPSTRFTITVPGKLTRSYNGALEVSGRDGVLRAILTLPTEEAVASIVAAESPPDAPFESLKAQAVASRSFLLAHAAGRGAGHSATGHFGADACDTTHCQFLRSAPPPGSPAARATAATRNEVLTWRPVPEAPAQIVPAMYARSCGGHTRAHPVAGQYPFYAVRCEFCLRHPERWTRQVPAAAAPQTEAERIAFNRLHGWSAVPSDVHTETGGRLTGQGTGHGIGLCQLGAQDLASRGMPYDRILAHFFPNTTLSTLR